ncbi:MAG: hypothetical protein ACAI25_20210 [Planctomycetota bacterium]
MRLTRRHFSDVRCAVCHDDLRGERLACDGCGTEIHEECRLELGRCPTFGCVRVIERHRTRPQTRWLAVALIFNVIAVPSTAVILAAAWCEKEAVVKPADPSVPAAASPARPRPFLPGFVSTEALRRECITLIENASPLEREFDERECTLLPEPISTLVPQRLTINAHAVTIVLAGTSVYVFDTSTHEPPRAHEDTRWTYLAEGVWAFVDR